MELTTCLLGELGHMGRDVLKTLPWLELLPFLGPEGVGGGQGVRHERNGGSGRKKEQNPGDQALVLQISPPVLPSSPNPRLPPKDEDGRKALTLRVRSPGARPMMHEDWRPGGGAGYVTRETPSSSKACHGCLACAVP